VVLFEVIEQFRCRAKAYSTRTRDLVGLGHRRSRFGIGCLECEGQLLFSDHASEEYPDGIGYG
jgi:hypothetical protein